MDSLRLKIFKVAEFLHSSGTYFIPRLYKLILLVVFDAVCTRKRRSDVIAVSCFVVVGSDATDVKFFTSADADADADVRF